MPIKGLKGGIGSKALGYGLGAAVEETDAEFNQTVLLLHGDGSEGEGDTAALGDPNYKAFKDNSTSAHAITVNGDTYGNDFSPYYYADGYWSNEFGSSNYLTVTDSDDFWFEDGDFTVEAWFYQYDGSTTGAIYSQWPTSGTSNRGTRLYLDYSSQRVDFAFVYSGQTTTRSVTVSSLAAYTLNEWHHVAATRNGADLRLFFDGVIVATFDISTNTLNNSSVNPAIGRNSASSSTYLDGYISNLRFVKGTALYTSAFTPSTEPFTTTSQGATASEVKLLTCQSNRFVDNSNSAHSITVSNTPKVSTNTPFTVTKTANVGSGFFDGDNDGLSIPESTDTRLSANDFTFECWYYGQSNTSANKNLFNQSTSGVYAPMNVYQYGNGVRVAMSSNGTSYNVLNDTTTYGTNGYVNQWNHVAVSRNGSNFAIFLNGTRVHNFTSSDTLMTPTQPTTIGVRPSNTDDYTGYISDSRLVIGSTIYDPTSSTITPPTASLTAVTNTKLLTCQYSGAVRNVGFLDDSKYNHQITRGGDVNMGTFSPFSLEDGYWSVYSDNADLSWGDINDTDFQFGTGDFTWELFVYLNATGQDHYFIGSLKSSPEVGFGFYYRNSSTAIRLYSSTAGTFDYSWTPSAGQWYHIALVRNSNSLACYVDGTEIGTAQSITGNVNPAPSAEKLEAPGNGYLSSSQDFYISNTRMCKTAVYTGNFTVPTSPLTTTSQGASNCVLLCNQSNRFLDNSSSGHASEIDTGTPKVQPFSPFAPSRSYSKDVVGGSAYFDGANDGLSIPESTDTRLSSNDFTFECWYYGLSSTSANKNLFNQSTAGTYSPMNVYQYGNGVRVAMSSNGTSYNVLNDTTTYGTNGYVNQWNHVAVSRDGSNFAIFLNGTRVHNFTSSATLMTPTQPTTLGVRPSNTDDYTGYISNWRLVIGSTIYDPTSSTLTLPTSPFSDTTDTKILIKTDNAGIIDHTMKNNLETEGNTRISGQQTKFGTGSMYFDGTGDYLYLPFSENFNFHTGSFTWEAWVYPTDISGIDGMYATSGGTGATAKFVVHLNAGTPSVHYNGVSSSNSYTAATSSISADTWTHLAYVRNGTTWTWYINGVASGTGSETGADLSFTTEPTYVGYGGESYFTPFNGYIDELRVTKGVARYTSNFTAPTKAFANR